jgi:hypothetical protein
MNCINIFGEIAKNSNSCFNIFKNMECLTKDLIELCTFLLKHNSETFDQSLADFTVVDATDNSTPLDRVPLNTEYSGQVTIMLLNSSQAASNSSLFNFGIPKYNKKRK